MLAEFVDPLDRPVNVVARQLDGARTQVNDPFAAIFRIGSLAQPAVVLEIGYAAADRRYGNASYPVKGSYAAGSPSEVATDHLIDNAQLIERCLTAVPFGQGPQMSSREFDNGQRRNVVWSIDHNLLSVPRISR